MSAHTRKGPLHPPGIHIGMWIARLKNWNKCVASKTIVIVK